LLPSQPLARLFEQALQSFKALTRGTAAVRAGKAGLLRNIRIALKNSHSEDLRALAESAQDGIFQGPGGG
jgi:epoxyqueuosine reductase QueG